MYQIELNVKNCSKHECPYGTKLSLPNYMHYRKKKIQIDMPSRTTSPFMNYKKSHGFHKSHARRKNINHSTADQHEEHDADLSRRAPLTNLKEQWHAGPRRRGEERDGP